MPSQEDIEVQQKLLLTYRRTLSHLLLEKAQFSVGHVPVHIANGIHDARDNIARIKEILRYWKVEVEDHPDDSQSVIVNWNDEALEAADILNDHHHEAHRGAILWRKGVVVIFESRNKENIEIYRNHLREENIEELSVRTSRHGGTTVILVRYEAVRKLNDLVWEYHNPNNEIISTQKSIAFRQIWKFLIDPLKYD